MVFSYEHIFSDEQLAYLSNLPATVRTRAAMNAKESGSINFSVPLTPSIKDTLRERLGLDLSSMNSIPMRWIKGDTQPHIDTGAASFQNTYLIYLTDSHGELVLGDEAHPILKGSAYVFSEELCHETVNTGPEPRLLLGPMSEAGLAVGEYSGTFIALNPGETAYIKEDSGSLFYSLNQSDWSTIDTSYPISIYNTNASEGLVYVNFTTNITITDSDNFFVCTSSGIQFGSTSLKEDGSRPVISITSPTPYPGLIQNGTLGGGYNDIYVYNLIVDGTGSSQADGAGWIGQVYYGYEATNNYIVNCSSSGDTNGSNNGAGGIVGCNAGNGSGAQLFLYGCSSSGIIGLSDGGIVGGYAGANAGSVTCEQCWSTGAISSDAGGIFGFNGGENGGSAEATKCYSTGGIGATAGGIFGAAAGSGGVAVAQKCYSEGNISAGGGGIYGQAAGASSGTTSATNCYSAGTLTTSGTGIYGSSKVNGTETQCYAANGSWSRSAAMGALSGTPNPVVGTVWVELVANTPFQLAAFGHTPYTVNIIDVASSELIQNYTQSVKAGESSIESLLADASGNSVAILAKDGGDSGSYDTITINAQTGAISTTAATVPGTYTLTIYSVGSYNITTFTLTVTEAEAAAAAAALSCCEKTLQMKGLDYAMRNNLITGNRVIGGEPLRRQPFSSYQDYYFMKMAYAAKR